MTTTTPQSKNAPAAIPAGAFEFGKNWASFLAAVDEMRIDQSIAALRSMLGVKSLVGKRFLDLGCGSGLSSLAAYRLGAEIVSVDYDPQCVACAQTLRSRFASDDRWVIRQGSVLNDVMLGAIDRYPPPSNRGRFVKIKYVTQLPTYFPAFAFFCNNPKHVKDNYRNYLENQLRKNFNFTGVPIAVFFRQK